MKTWFTIVAAIFLLLSVHLWAKYAESVSALTGKWWTIIEWKTQKVVYLPYLSTNKDDKFYQSLLLRSCGVLSTWSNPVILNDLCDITTSDYQTFFVSIVPNNYRSDWKQITLQDIQWTHTLLINNTRELASMSAFSKVTSETMSWNRLRVTFPRASIDNNKFFLSPILPRHVLVNKNLEYYQREFSSNPVTSSCAKILPNTSDKDSIIFNTINCDSIKSAKLQVKRFGTMQDLYAYTAQNPQRIDFYLWEPTTWYAEYLAPTSTYLIAHFNTMTLADQTRRNIWALMLSASTWLVNYEWMFGYTSEFSGSILTTNLSTAPTQTVTTWLQIPALTRNILIKGTNKFREWFLPTISDRFVLSLRVDPGYDKIWVSANWWSRYFPDSFNASLWTLDYALAPKFQNIRRWINYYTIRWVKNGVSTKLMTLTVHYQTQPQQTIDQPKQSLAYTASWWRLIRVLYIKEPVISKYIVSMQDKLNELWISSSFQFIPLDNRQELEARAALNEYEIVITLIDFGQKADIWVLISDDQTINYSRFKDPNLRRYISEYYLSYGAAQRKLQTSIQQTYYRQLPFIILGKVPRTWSIKKQQAMPKLWDDSFVRNNIINALNTSQTLQLNKDTLLSKNNFLTFILRGLSEWK